MGVKLKCRFSQNYENHDTGSWNKASKCLDNITTHLHEANDTQKQTITFIGNVRIIVENGWEWLRMGWEWLGMVENGWEWLSMVENGLRMVENGLRMVNNG